MFVYRIINKKYAGDVSGYGAAKYGGRWNRKNTPVLYTGASKEIALLETIVHTPPLFIPELELIVLQIPDDSIKTLTPNDLPVNWHVYPAPDILADIGEDWVRSGKTLALKVPSCIIHTSFNYILNCNHERYKEVKIYHREPFQFDLRLKKF